MYENSVAEADNTLRDQKRELEENAAQRARTYENAVAEAENTLRKTTQKLERFVFFRAQST